MPNINLLEGKDYTRDVEKMDSDSVSFQDFQEEMEPKEDLAEPANVEEEAIKSESPDKTISYRRYSSPWPKIVGVAGVLIIICIFVFFKFFRGTDTTTQQDPPIVDSTAIHASTEVETTKTGTQRLMEEEVVEDQTRGEPSVQRPVDPIITNTVATLSESRKSGAAGASLLADFLSSFPSGMKLSFFRYGNVSYSAEIAASSANIFAQFEQNLKMKNSSIQMNIISDSEVFVGDRVIIMRQISGSSQSLGDIPRANKAISSNRIKGDLNAAVIKYNLQIRQFDISPTITSGNNNIRLTTLKIFGNQERLSSFIHEILNTYNNIGVNKMMISVLSSSDLLDNNVMATLDLDIYLE